MAESTVLTELSKAELALAKASSLIEMKQLRDQAAALGVLADAQGFERAAQQAKIFQLKAERKAGEWLSQHSRPEGRPRKLGHDVRVISSTLEEAGLSPKKAYRWQLEAKVPEPEFRKWLGHLADQGTEISAAGLQRFAKQLTGGPREVSKPTQRHECPECGQVHVIKASPTRLARPPVEGANHVRRIAELAFREVRPVSLPANGKEQGSLWWQPLRELCDMAGWKAERVAVLIWEADAKMRLDNLTVSSPKSLIKVANAIVGEFRARRREPSPTMLAKAKVFCDQHLQ